MDREGFRNRLKQYKQAREENPGLKYWEWKDIPKYDEGTKLVDSIDPKKIVYYHGNEIISTFDDQIKHYNQFKDKAERNAYLDYEKKYILDKLTQESSTGWGVAVDGGELPEVTVSPSKQHYVYLETEYPFINPDTPYTGHSTLYSDSGSFTVSTGGYYPNYNLFTNNCSNSTCRVLERALGKKNDAWFFTTPGDVKDFAEDQLNAIEIESDQRGTKLHKIPVTLDQLRKIRYEAYNEEQRLRNRPELSLDEFKKLFKLQYAEGGEVTGPPTYEQWDADMNQYNPTILDNASMYWSIEAAKKALHKEAMKLPGYAERWTEYYRSLPKNDPDINEFVDELWANENPNNVGYNPVKKKYFPHKSPEGGKPTIGPGFKIGSGSHRITKKQAERGMTKARLDQEARYIGKQHLNAVDQFINYGQTTNPADTVSPQIKMGLMDLRHQVGPLNEWGNLRQAVLNGDLEGIRKESTTTWNDNGKIKVDTRRKKIRDEKYFYYE